MGEIEDPEFKSTVEEASEQRISPSNSAAAIHDQTITQPKKSKKWWAWMIIYTLFILLGQATATLLERLYYNKGGNNIFLAALLETIGFPILIPFSLYFSRIKNDRRTNDHDNDHQPSILIRSMVYIFLGFFQAASSILYSIGLQNLPVSTFSLINTTQLAFNAFFSFFLNKQKFTPPILNSLVLLTISSTLLIFQSGDDSQNNHEEHSRREKFILGFSCTLVASALFSLTLSTTQLAFHKVLKRETISTILNVIIYESLVSNCIVSIPLFISGKWRFLRGEMVNFELGKGMYVTVVVTIAVCWQVCSIGTIGLIFEVSSLFSNVISTVGLPIIPIFAAIFFHEKMDGLKVISIVLAVWGFVSYVYQHYLNDCNSSTSRRNEGENVTVSHLLQETL